MSHSPRKLAPMADRVARALAQEARVAAAMGDAEVVRACLEAFKAIRYPVVAARRSAPTGRFTSMALTAVAVLAPIVSLGGLLLAGLAIV